MGSREQILAALRANKLPFDSVPPRPTSYLPVTPIPADDLVVRFTAELERLTGKVYVAANLTAAIDQVLTLIGEDKSVLMWDKMPELDEALSKHQITGIVPQFEPTQRHRVLQDFEPIRVGITGADAALATTGTLVLAANRDQARLVSLLPVVHIALLPLNRLHANMEAWLAAMGKQAVQDSSAVTFITGPSRTSDIEMQTILGVHGPREVHVVLIG